jgi:hypothetical protein
MTDILKGPWRVGVNLSEELTIESKDSRFYLATVLKRPEKDQYAIATLMAASPKMLEALKAAHMWLQGSEPGRAQYIGEVIEEATRSSESS